MKKAALHNLGCKVNAYETQAMREILEQAGYEIVPFSEWADVYVVNTCTVTNIADRKSRQMLHRARKKNPEAIIVAAGCYVQNAAREGLNPTLADIYIGNDEKTKLVHAIADYEKEHRMVAHVLDINRKKEMETLQVHVSAGRARAFLKIQDGCNQFCTYCVIPYVRGRIRSASPKTVLAQVRELAAQGYREIVLNGIHLGSYGKDFDTDLVDLLEEIEVIDGISRVRLGSLEPGFMTDDHVARLAKLKKLCPHFHLSLQSGCDSVLSRMGRRYTTADYKETVERLRKAFDRPAMTTDVITGFPGETEEEFETTHAFLKDIGFYEVHVFPYSMRAGTKAAAMDQQIPETIKKERSRILLTTVESLKCAYETSFAGETVSVLLEEEEERDGKIYWKGHTPQYMEVLCEGDNLQAGKFYEGVLSDGIVRK